MAQSKLDEYIESVRRSNPGLGMQIAQARARAERDSLRHPDMRKIDLIEQANSRVGRLIKARRYDDVFEGIMKYADEDAIFDDKSLKEQLEKGLDMRRDEKGMTSTVFKRMVDNLARKTSSLPRVRQRLLSAASDRIEAGEERAAIRHVPLDKRDKFRKYISEGRELWTVFDKKQRRRTVVYRTSFEVKGVRRMIFRDLSTGRFGKNPYKGVRK